MKNAFVLIAWLLTANNLFAQRPTSVPAEAKKFMLKGYELLDYIKGDVNKDKKEDAILLLKSPEENKDTIHIERPRPLLLLVRNASNRLELKLRNDSFMMCKVCGGLFGDPYQGIAIEKDTIKVYFYGGSRYRWMENYFFSYNKSTQQWQLVQHVKDSYDNAHPEKNTPTAIIPKEELKGLTLANTRTLARNVIVSTNWKVTSNKAFFYTSPNLKTRPRKAYIMKGEVVDSDHETVNFVFVEYWKEQTEKTTRGYILKKNLQRINQ